MILVRRQIGDGRGSRQYQPDQLIVETILHRQQHTRYFDESGIGRRVAVFDDIGELRDFLLHALPQFTESEHAQRVADLFQQFELRNQLVAAAAAAPHENIQDVLDLRQILFDRGRDRAHQFDAGSRQTLPLLLDGIIDGQQLGQLE